VKFIDGHEGGWPGQVKVRDHETVAIGDDITLDLSGVEQLVEAPPS
jgi:hypothetical protein